MQVTTPTALAGLDKKISQRAWAQALLGGMVSLSSGCRAKQIFLGLLTVDQAENGLQPVVIWLHMAS